MNFDKEEMYNLGEVIFDMTLAIHFLMPEDADIDSRDIYNDIFEWANEFEKGRIDNNNKYYISLDDFIRNKIMEEYPEWFD